MALTSVHVLVLSAIERHALVNAPRFGSALSVAKLLLFAAVFFQFDHLHFLLCT